ncbi:hypothetical protein ACCO45_011625 [Purpureocillium lilacinum]|uniref:Uncharacterized protein n=1 Tax=Purpureocillium lilacinum TaxID=33203 RepID=A0ACC4DDK4_PURLI
MGERRPPAGEKRDSERRARPLSHARIRRMTGWHAARAAADVLPNLGTKTSSPDHPYIIIPDALFSRARSATSRDAASIRSDIPTRRFRDPVPGPPPPPPPSASQSHVYWRLGIRTHLRRDAHRAETAIDVCVSRHTTRVKQISRKQPPAPGDQKPELPAPPLRAQPPF